MIRLLLVDDHEIVRRGLRELLESNADLSVTQQAGSLEAALFEQRQFDREHRD